jgi:hypothetical protein
MAQTQGTTAQGAARRTAGKRDASNRPSESRSFSPSAADSAVHPVQAAIRKYAMNPKLSYAQIAKKVCETVEGAQTSDRSVASVVHGLRADGVAIPEREGNRGGRKPQHH